MDSHLVAKKVSSLRAEQNNSQESLIIAVNTLAAGVVFRPWCGLRHTANLSI